MQLVKLSKSIKPIRISASILSAASTFIYSDMNAHSGIITITTNNTTSEYIKESDKNIYTDYLTKYRFQQHLINWENKTMFSSSVKTIVDDVDFLSIVAMGKSVTPLIIQEIEKKPSTLVWALNFIYNEKISEKQDITISEACRLWVKKLKK